MAYGNSRGKNPGLRKPRPGAKRNGVGASSSTRGGKFSGKNSGGGKPKSGTSGSPRAARSHGARASKRDRRAPHRPYRSGEAFPHERGEYRVNNYSGHIAHAVPVMRLWIILISMITTVYACKN